MWITLETKYNKSFISLLAYSSLVFAGVLLSFLFVIVNRGEMTVLCHCFLSDSLSFVMLLASSLIPLVISMTLVRVGWHLGLYVLAAFKTFSFSFCVWIVFAAFPLSGWLAQMLVLFSQWLEMYIYHWFWMRILVFKRPFSYRDWGICFAVLSLIVLFDYFLIYPFTASLFILK